jgi:hypothetical protein
MQTGTADVHVFTVDRSEKPVLFWAQVAALWIGAGLLAAVGFQFIFADFAR